MEGGDFSRLNEDCICRIFSFTLPRDVCRSSAVSSAFQSAAEYDSIWEGFLPSDYLDLLSRSVSPVVFSSKKDLYFRLCNPILIDNGKRSFWLERSSGKKCFMVPARDVIISWGDDRRYWQWSVAPSTRIFPEIAQLIHVWWFDLRGTFDMADLSPNTTYTVQFIVRLPPDHHGWNNLPIRLSLNLRNESHVERRVVIVNSERGERNPSNVWMEVEAGNFYCDGNGGEVEFRMFELHSLKCGLDFMGIVIRPNTCFLDEERAESSGLDPKVSIDYNDETISN